MASISDPFAFAPTPQALAFALDELEELGGDGGGAVAASVRRAALEAYRRFGSEQRSLPPRWRYDYESPAFEDLVWLSGRSRVPGPPRRKPQPKRADGAGDVPALEVENAGGLVHLGSVYLEPGARAGDARVTLLALADAQRALPKRVAALAGRIVAPHSDRFAALATAFQNCGAYVEIPAGIAVGAPLQLVWTARPGPAGAVFPQTLVRVGAGARATIVERHVGESESFVCGTVEVDLEPGARLDYVVLQNAGDAARLLFRRAARCAEGSRMRWHAAELGGGLVRSGIASQLAGSAACSDVHALFFARGFVHVDLAVTIAHDASHSGSQTIVRGAATDRGQGLFAGSIRIPRGTRGCNASMRDDSLVLSRDAYLEATPALEIDANDVSAMHAATVGSLDAEQLFYVQTRGFARGMAERMIALAFFEPALARFPSEALRDEVRTALDERLEEIPETFVS